MSLQKKGDYKSKAKTTMIEAHSRLSVKIRESFYTFEFVERREIPANCFSADLEKESALLWNEVNAQVDMQVQDLVDSLKKS